MPPRMAAPTPAARIAAKPPYKSRLAFGVIPVPLLIGFLFGYYGLTFGAGENNGFRFVTAAGLVVKPNGAKHRQEDGRQDGHHPKGSLRRDAQHFIQLVTRQRFERSFATR